jgi:CheY-like chemotaxis protein
MTFTTQLPTEDAMGSTKTILVVEDNPDILFLVKTILVQGGDGRLIEGGGATHRLPHYEVLTADSAEKGLVIGLEFPRPIHLLIADVVMPGMLGTTLATRLKEARPAMAVMLMSGYPEREIAVSSGGWHFLQKPFQQAALLEVVRMELGGGSMRAGGR